MLLSPIEDHKLELERARAATGEPFKAHQQLTDAQEQVAEIEKLMRAKQEQEERERSAAPPAPADATDDVESGELEALAA
jgi:hypothetical protein